MVSTNFRNAVISTICNSMKLNESIKNHPHGVFKYCHINDLSGVRFKNGSIMNLIKFCRASRLSNHHSLPYVHQ